MIELYHFMGATCGLKARLAVDEKGVDVTDRAVERAFLKTPEYLKLNRNGVVPTLVDDGEVFTESTVIINYLDDLDPNRPLKPRAPLGRARTLWWMKRADDVLPNIGIVTYTMSMRVDLEKLDADERAAHLAAIPDVNLRARRQRILELGFDNPDVPVAARAVRLLLQDMEVALADHAYLAGGDYSLADLAVTPLIERLDELTIGQHLLAEGSRLSGWWNRIRERPSYARCVLGRPNPDAARHRERGAAAWPGIASCFAA